MRFFLVLWILIGLVIQMELEAQSLELSPIFTDNMVLQANKPIPIWGRGKPNSEVFVTLAQKKKKVKINDDSTWMVMMPKFSVSEKPIELEVVSNNKVIKNSNILVGEVWLCIGQSNMLFPLRDDDFYENESGLTNQTNIRFFTPSYIGRNYGVKKHYTDEMLRKLEGGGNFYKGKWVECTDKTAKIQSAIGYYFSKKLLGTLNTPVGIINMAVEGSPIEAWISEKYLAGNKKLSKKIKGNWLFNPDLPLWARVVASYNLSGKPTPPATLNMNEHPYKPGFLFKEGIAKIAPFGIKGILIYQGETNTETVKQAEEYKNLLLALIKNYRQKWADTKLPFYWVQLPSIESTTYRNALYWPEFRNQQWQVVRELKSYVGIVPSYDVSSENTMPTNKKVISGRLAALVLFDVYKKKVNPYPLVPIPIAAKYGKEGVVVSFMNTGSGLSLYEDIELHGFSINGTTETRAVIYKDKYVLIETNKKPKIIYYAWKPNTTEANLVNSGRVPAIAFKIKVD